MRFREEAERDRSHFSRHAPPALRRAFLSPQEDDGGWRRAPGFIEQCENPDDRCVLFEKRGQADSTWELYAETDPVYVAAPATPTYNGYAGCASTVAGNKYVVDVVHLNASFSAQDCRNYQAYYLGSLGTPLLAECVSCKGDLCNVRGGQDPEWYSNCFGVSEIALSVAMDLYKEPLDSFWKYLSASNEFCDSRKVGDGVCHLEYNVLGCDYDGGDCCDADADVVDIGEDFSGGTSVPICQAPWQDRTTAPWRFAVTTSDGKTHATVPPLLHRAVRDKLFLEFANELQTTTRKAASTTPPLVSLNEHAVVQLQADFDEIINGLAPSLACPECASFGETYRTIDFNVTVSDVNRAAGFNPGGEAMFPQLGADDMRLRFMSSPNLVLYGPLLTQTRSKQGTCPSNSEYASELGALTRKFCHLDEEGDGRYGVDATFVEGAHRFRASNWDARDALYPSADDIMPSGIPVGFSYDMGGAGARNFPVLFSVNMNNSRAGWLLDVLEDGRYFDYLTRKAVLSVVLFNLETETLGYLRFEATRQPEGATSFEWDLKIINPQPHAKAEDLCRLAFEIVFVLYLGRLLLVELAEMRELGTRAYLLNLFNFTDLLGYSLHLALVGTQVRFVLRSLAFSPQRFYQVYANELAVGRLLEANEQMARLQDVLDMIEGMAATIDSYEVICLFSGLVMTVQPPEKMDFHPEMGLVTRTLSQAKVDLFFFLLILFCVITVYALLGTLLFGRDVDSFSSIYNSYITLARATCALYDSSVLGTGW